MDWLADYYQGWRRVARRCEPCARLLGYCVHGWGLPAEHSPPDEAWQAERARRRWIERRARRSFNRPVVETDDGERLLRAEDGREVWERSELEEPPFDKLFPNKRGRPPLHRWLTPEVLDGVLTDLEVWVEHLEPLSLDRIREHLEEVFGPEPEWPPHLTDVEEAVRERWTWRYGERSPSWRRSQGQRRGLARLVATKLPVEMDVTLGAHTRTYTPPPDGSRRGMPSRRGGPPVEVVVPWRERIEDVSYRPCPWTAKQLEYQDHKR